MLLGQASVDWQMPRPLSTQMPITAWGVWPEPGAAVAADVAAVSAAVGCAFVAAVESGFGGAAPIAVFSRRLPFVVPVSDGPGPVSSGGSGAPCPVSLEVLAAVADISGPVWDYLCLEELGVQRAEYPWDGSHCWDGVHCFLDAPTAHEPIHPLWPLRLRHLLTLLVWELQR